MSNPDDKNEIVGEDAVNAWLDRVRIISVKDVSPSAPKGQSLPLTTRWPVSAAVAADLNAIPLDADTMAAARFAAANLRAWANYVEKTGDGLRVEPYSISVDTPLDRHIGMAPLASAGSVGWRHAPKLQHRNRGFGDHGDHPWSDHHKHGAHPPLPRLDVPPPAPPCPVCAMEVYICRCDEDDLRDAIRERDAQIKTLTAERDEARGHLRAEMDEALAVRRASGASGQEQTALVVEQTATWARTLEARAGASDPWCVAVGESATPRRGPKGKWFLSKPTCRHRRFSGAGSATRLVNLLSPGTPICCPKVRLRGRSVRRKSVDVTRRCIVDLFDDLTAAAENNAPCPRCDSPSGPYNGWGAVVTRVKDQSETISEARQILGALHAETVVGTTISNACDPRAHIEVVEGVAICRCPVEVP